MSKTFTPSAYQQAIFDWVADGTGSAIVKAVAGSGKTTTVKRCLPFIPEHKSVQLLAFNNSAAKSLKEAIAMLVQESRDGRQYKGVRANTFHSLGYGAILKRLALKPEQITTTDKKIRNVAKSLLGDLEYDVYADFCVHLVGLAKGAGIGPLTPDVADAWYTLISHHDLYLDDVEATEERAIVIARDLLRESNRLAEIRPGSAPIIDYDDMLYLPLLWRCKLWQNDWVFVDEAQDTSPARRALAKLALRPGGRLVAVGDDRQAIYGFTGASADAMDLIREEFRCVELPLTVSYRCPKAVAVKVRDLVPYFEVPESAIEGEVKSCTLADAMTVLGPQDAILCRQTAPLVELCFNLIGRGKPCAVLGKDIATGLVSLINRQKAKGLDALIAKLEDYRDREVAKHMAKGEEGKAEAVSDRVACILTIASHLNERERTVPALVRKIEDMFTEGNDVLSLATIHKVKGREYRRVAILMPELMPSKWARQEHQYQQELNLQYVGWTRAMETLMELTTNTLPEPRKVAPAEVVA